MKLEDLIKERRTVHEYQKVEVDWNIVSRALELSLWSLNHKLTFPWVYYRVGPLAKQKIAEILVEKKEAKKGPLSEIMQASIRSKILNPSEVIFLGQKKAKDAHQQKEDYATLACSIQLASLYLWEQGLGSKWSTGDFTQSEKTFAALNIDTKEVEIVGCLFVGVAANTPKTTLRPPLAEVLVEVP